MKNVERAVWGLVVAVLLSGGLLHAQIRGKVGQYNVTNEAQKVMAALIGNLYESHEFTVGGGGNRNMTQDAPDAFSDLTRAHLIILRTDADIQFRFNSPSNDLISMAAHESPFSFNALEVSSIYFWDSSGANVKVILQ